MAAETFYKRADKSMASEDAIYAPRCPLTHRRNLPAAVCGHGHWIAVLACFALLLPPSVALPGTLPATLEGLSARSTDVALTAKAAGLLSLFAVHAQVTAYAADSGKRPEKTAPEFFQEFLDLALKVLVSINLVVTIVAAVRFWLGQRTATRRRKELRICPRCYELIRGRKATRCPYCRVELAPESRNATLSPPSAPDRAEPAHRDAVRTTQPRPAIYREPSHAEAHRDGPQEREGERWEEEESGADDWEREEQTRYRKQRIYAVISAIVLGWVTAGLVFLLRLV